MIQKQTGFTLMEVVISQFLLALILLMVNDLFITAMKENTQAYCVTVAAIQLASIQDRLRWQEGAIDKAIQIKKWNGQNQQLLPFGVGKIEGDHYILCWKLGGRQHCLNG